MREQPVSLSLRLVRDYEGAENTRWQSYTLDGVFHGGLAALSSLILRPTLSITDAIHSQVCFLVGGVALSPAKCEVYPSSCKYSQQLAPQTRIGKVFSPYAIATGEATAVILADFDLTPPLKQSITDENNVMVDSQPSDVEGEEAEQTEETERTPGGKNAPGSARPRSIPPTPSLHRSDPTSEGDRLAAQRD